MQQSDKKVEYIELIYDLIFVYLIGRNNSLLDMVEGGFVSAKTLITFLILSLIILQIWYHTALFINRYGSNGIAENVMLLVNMFLLYIMGTGTINEWGEYYDAYVSAWTLILLNLALQYGLKLNSEEDASRKKNIVQNIIVLCAQAAVAAVSIPVYHVTGWAFAPWAMAIGFAAAPFIERVPVNFAHLTERVMLYVVFTFGEMVITAAGYFSGGFSWDTLYFALMSFLIVAGLFFSYGFMYDRLLDRSRESDGTGYLLLNVFLLIDLSNVTNALDLMRNPEVDPFRVTVFMVISLLIYFGCLAATERWSTRQLLNRGSFVIGLVAMFGIYTLIMLFMPGSRYISVAVTVIFICVQLLHLSRAEKSTEKR